MSTLFIGIIGGFALGIVIGAILMYWFIFYTPHD